ncbi:MAG: AAA family ATPase, partial [Deltaproteobacteria bacterium]|nr:AAA family ATPase [Deltaproteobacteria bacterium]
HGGRLVTKQELLDGVWPETVVGEAVLKVYVRELRQAMKDEAKSPSFIETVHRRGYRFIGPPSTSPSPVPSAQFQVPRSEDRRPRTESSLEDGQGRPMVSRHWPSALVGRDKELQQLFLWGEKALQGERQILFVTGEAGIGKTTVIEAFLAQFRATTDCSFASGQCVEHYGIGEAYRPIFEAVKQLCREPGHEHRLEMLRQYAPTWLLQMPSLLSAEERERLQREVLGATQERMLREIAEAIEVFSGEKLLVLVLEDLQWSDNATLDLVATLARRREPTRLLVIGTYRPVDVIMSGHPLKTVKQDLLIHGHCQELPIELLPEAAVVEYLRTRFVGADPELLQALGRVIYHRTDGNPLFLVNVVNDVLTQPLLIEHEGRWELLTTMSDVGSTVPDTIRQMIERQVERLPTEEQAVLEAASVVGVEFSTALVATALARDTQNIETACERLARQGQFLQTSEVSEWPDGTVTGRYQFRHALYQQVLFQRVAPGRRTHFHQCIGTHLASAYGDRVGEVAAELAMHFEQGRDYRRALHFRRQAADNAARQYANREALEDLARALALVPRLTEAEQPPLQRAILEQRGLLFRSMGAMPHAVEDLTRAAEIARTYDDLQSEVRMLSHVATALSWVSRDTCLQAVQRIAALSPHLQEEDLRHEMQGVTGYYHLLWEGWRQEDMTAVMTAADTARRIKSVPLLGMHTGRLSYFHCLRSEYHTAIRTAAEGRTLTQQAGDAHNYLLCHFFQAWALLHHGQWGEMYRLLHQGIAMAEKNGHHLWAMLFRLEMAWLLTESGDFVQARTLCEQGARQADEMQLGYGQLVSPILLGFAHLGLQDTGAALRCFQTIAERLARERLLMDWIWRMPLHYGLSQYWLLQGHSANAQREAARVCEIAEQPGERTYLVLGRSVLIECALAQQQYDQAEELLMQTLPVLDEYEAPLAEWRLGAAAGRLYDRLQQRTKANRHWARGAEIVTRLAGSLVEVPHLYQSFLSLPAVQTILA